MEKDKIIHILAQAIESLTHEGIIGTSEISARVVHDILHLLKKDSVSSTIQQQLLHSRALINLLIKDGSDIFAKHEASAIISDLVKSGVIPPYIGGRGSNPQQWVAENVVPHLPESVRHLAFDQSIYSSTIPNLYKIIRVWRATGKAGVEKFYSSR